MTAGHRPVEPHPDLDTLADLDAGVLERGAADRVTAHVASCARCGQVMGALGGVRADLRALPAPPVPAAVAARLDSALAGLRAEGPSPAAADAARAAPVADLDAARARRWRRLRAMGGAAAAVLVLFAAGASVVSLVRAGGRPQDSAAGGGRAAGEHQTSRQQSDNGAASVAAPYPSLPAYTSATLRAALATLEKDPLALGGGSAGDRSALAGAMADAALQTACEQTIPGRRGVLRAVRWIRYDGQPAYVFVFDDAGRRTAYVVGEQCGRTPAVPATVLDTVR
ncbi:MAG: hypothetical protein ACJ73E_08120 [Mycobacteriales bacterium]